jgi:hypothetical protein
MTTKHTPGPWVAAFGNNRATVVAPADFEVASAPMLRSTDKEFDRNHEVMAANATLIASAPESLDAGAIEHDAGRAQELDNVVVAHDEGRPLADCDCWVQRARTALAKARGGGG